MSYKSWTPPASWASACGSIQPNHWISSPAPTPGAPHIHTVSLPHPNSTPHHHSSHCMLPYISACVSSDRSYAGDMPSGYSTPHILALNPLLSYAGRPPLYFNISQDIQHIRLLPGCSPALLQAHAINHFSTQLHIRFPGFPYWSVEVTNPRGVTVHDVLVRIRETLNRSVSPQEASVSPLASEYFRARTHADPREYAQGVKRIDMLGQNVYFAGLSQSRDGPNHWDVHFCRNA